MKPALPEQPQPDRPRRAWVAPQVIDLPRLTNLTLATGFAPDKRSRSGGGSVIF